MIKIDEYEFGVPLRLYLQLNEGEFADIEVISKATLAFAAGVREISYALDPTIDLRIGALPFEEGSLWQSTVLQVRGAKRRLVDDYQSKRTLYNLAAASMIWFLQPPFERFRNNQWKPILDQYLPEAEPDEIQKQGQDIDRIFKAKVAEKERERVYRELSRDSNIRGAGITIQLDSPKLIVPKDEFYVRSGRGTFEEQISERVTREPLRVVLISPVLDLSDRKWKFATPTGEFGASIKDRAFLEKIAMGRTSIPMRGGIEMDVEIEKKERLIDGVWQETSRSILEVRSLNPPAGDRQIDLFFDDRD